MAPKLFPKVSWSPLRTAGFAAITAAALAMIFLLVSVNPSRSVVSRPAGQSGKRSNPQQSDLPSNNRASTLDRSDTFSRSMSDLAGILDPARADDQALLELLRSLRTQKPDQSARLLAIIRYLLSNEAEAQKPTPAWTSEELRQALFNLEPLLDSDRKSIVLTGICSQLVHYDPGTAMAVSESISAESQSNELIAAVCMEWAAISPQAAADWISEGVNDLELKDSLQLRLAVNWAQDQPVAAAAYVSESMPPGGVQSEAARIVANRWAYLDPAAATTWIISFPDPVLRRELLATAISSWKAKDAKAMQTWVSKLNEPSLRADLQSLINP